MSNILWQEQISRIRTVLLTRYATVAPIFTDTQTVITKGDFNLKLDRFNRIYIGKKFFEEDLTFFNQVTLYLKYHIHAALRHSSRASMYADVDQTYFELACDVSINESLTKDNSLDTSHLLLLKNLHPDLVQEDLVEQLAAKLKELFPPEEGFPFATSLDFGETPGDEIIYVISDGLMESSITDTYWETKMSFFARDPNSPDVIKSLPVGLCETSTFSQQVKRFFVSKFGGSQYRSNYKKPSKRVYAGSTDGNVFIPSRERINLPERKVVVCFDTSYSCWSEKIRDEFLTILDDLVIRYQLVVDLVMFDTLPQKIVRYVPKEKVGMQGGGGTNFRPLFELQIQSLNGETLDNSKTDLMIILTDLEGPFPDKTPSYDVLWILPESYKNKAPFGKVINGHEKDNLLPSLR